MILFRVLFLCFVLIMHSDIQTCSAHSHIWFQSKEWYNLEHRVRELIKHCKHLDNNKEYELYPIFWMKGTHKVFNLVDANNLEFTYYPRRFPFRPKRYLKCTVLISDNGVLVAIADARGIQLCNQWTNKLYERVLEGYKREKIDAAFYLSTDLLYLNINRIYCMKNNVVSIIEE